ncbi:MAG: murein biosynthesis integral membrane protein MurJ [bacterium]
MSVQAQEQIKIAKAASIVGAATLLSRIFGYGRDMVVALLFGAGSATDAFFVAFRIPNLLRRLVGEGALTASFIPVYSEYLNQKSKEESDELVNASFSILTVSLIIIAGLGIIFSPLIVKIMAYGFTKDAAKFHLTVLLTRIMFPYIFFIGLVALAMGVLNSWKHFTAPALAPVLLNICIIISALLFHKFLAEPIISLALGVITGGVAQLSFQIPFLLRQGIRWRFFLNFSHPGVRRIGMLMAPSVLGLGVTQLNVLVSTFLASYLPQGSVSYLYYADRLLEFPMGIFAIAIATAVLPTMSDQRAKNDIRAMKETLAFSLRLTFLVIMPAMVGLIALRQPLINVLFQRGAFDAQATEMTAHALLFYALGLIFFAGVRIIVPAFYSLQDTKTPVKAASLALIANAVLGAWLMIPLKHGGLALATSLAAGINLAFLIIKLRRKIGSIGSPQLIRAFGQSLAASLVMGVAIYVICAGCSWETSGVTTSKILFLVEAIVVGATIYGLITYFWGKEEIRPILMAILRKLKSQAKPG